MTDLRQDRGITHAIAVELSGFRRDVILQTIKCQQTCGQDAHVILPWLDRPIVQSQA